MPNTLDPLIITLLAKGVQVLRETALMPMLVNQEYSEIAKRKGQTIDVPVSKAKTPYNVTPSHQDKQPGNSEQLYERVTLDQWKGLDFYLTDAERTRIAKEETFMPQQAAECVRGLANAVNEDILSKYTRIFGFTGTPGTTPFSNATDRTAAKDATNLYATLSDQLCPILGRTAVIDTVAQAEALALPYFANADKAGDTQVIRAASLGTKFGIDWYVESAIPYHTAGAPGGAPTVSGAHAAAAADRSDTLAVTAGGAAGTFNAGDVITIAGHSQTYVVTADAALDGLGDGSISIAPGLQAALAGGEAITVKGNHRVNLGFHREAFALATAPFEVDDMPGVESQWVRDPVTGLVLRLEKRRQYKQTVWEFDILWGSQCVRPEFAVRLAG